MTKQELLEALEPFDNDTEIMIVIKARDDLTRIIDIVQVTKFDWSNDREEIWLYPGKTP